MRALAVFVVVLVAAAVVLLACRPPAADGTPTEPAATTAATAPTPLALPQPLSHATADTPAARGGQMPLTQPPAAPTTTMIPLPPHHAIWLELAECESGGDWAINTGNGYYGGLQFALTSWRAAGGGQYATHPHYASPLGQMWTAEVLLGMQGWGAWPGCTRKLGLR